MAKAIYTQSQRCLPPSLTHFQPVNATSVNIYHHGRTYYHLWWLAHVECLQTIHTQEGGSCSLYISGREQAANYKTTLGAWLFLGIAAVLLHAEWGK